MYINDVHILIYVAIAIVGFFIGKLINWANYRMLENKKIISKEILKKDFRYKPNTILAFVNAILYVVLLYIFGIGKTFLDNIELIRYLILTPMILSAFIIDYKEQIIPNRLNLTIFECGIILMVLAGIFNVNIAIDMFAGMIVGGGIFLLITLIGGLIAGKEAMGFGDVKLMAGLGLYFGFANTIMLTLVAFLLGAIISIILLITKIKKTDEYIPFGPFIVVACFAMMMVPFKTILSLLVTIFSLGLMNI